MDVLNQIDHFFSGYPKRSYPKGQILVFAGEKPTHIFYIKRGRVRKYDVSYRGDEVIVNVFKPPAFFEVDWALNHTFNKYFFKTETSSDFHIAPLNDINKLLNDNPKVTLDLIKRVYRGVEGIQGRLVHLMSGTAKSRLIYEILIECKRFSNIEEDGSYKLDITEADIAARTGLSRETVSRELQSIKKEGIIKSSSRGVIVKDIKILENKINHVF
jgi:CRP-like cAMP-binding protein